EEDVPELDEGVSDLEVALTEDPPLTGEGPLEEPLGGVEPADSPLEIREAAPEVGHGRVIGAEARLVDLERSLEVAARRAVPPLIAQDRAQGSERLGRRDARGSGALLTKRKRAFEQVLRDRVVTLRPLDQRGLVEQRGPECGRAIDAIDQGLRPALP